MRSLGIDLLSEVLMKPILNRVTGMNKTETSYSILLQMMKTAGEIIEWRFEAVKFRLAKATFYTPDFMIVYQDRIEIHEVKGWWRDDARVKIKVAAQMYPWFKFIAVSLKNKRWEFKEF